MTTAKALVLVLISTTSFAFKSEGPGKLLRPSFKEAPACDSRPEFLSEIRTDFTSNLQQLPPTVLVAREAEFYVEGTRENTPVKLHGYQSFLRKNPTSQVLCGKAPTTGERFSLLAPTLIDTNKNPRVGQSLWQFQMMSDGGKYSFWNLKSPSFGAGQNIEALLKESGATYKVYQRSHDEFELLVTKKEGTITQYLSIRYDAVESSRL
jgi:hypothetical protein